MPQRPRVTVLGSLNTDISLPVPHLPGPGETVLSAEAATIGSGGKGANQAVAAARLGGAVRMVGCLGHDDFGDRLRAGVTSEGVDASGVRAVPGVSSGLALINVDPAGENSIAVAAGANGQVGDTEVAAVFAAACDVLVLSAEVPASALAAALRQARERGVTTLLNLAPVPAAAQQLLACGPDWLVVNEQEATALSNGALSNGAPSGGAPSGGAPSGGAPSGGAPSGGAPSGGALPHGPRPGAEAGTAAAARVAAGLVAAGGGRHVVITLGAAGAVLATPGPAPAQPTTDPPGATVPTTAGPQTGNPAPGGPGIAVPAAAGPRTGGPGTGGTGTGGTVAVPGLAVASVDSVGAGDAFVGALAVALAAGLGPVDAVRAACAAGATATTKRGAQAALPDPAAILAATGHPWPVP